MFRDEAIIGSIVQSIVVGLIVGAITSFTAYRKGYSAGWWLLGGSCLGLLIVAFLPNTNDPYLKREQRQAMRKRGNVIGICLSSLVVILIGGLLFRSCSGK